MPNFELMYEYSNKDASLSHVSVIRKGCACTHALLQTGNKKVNDGLKRDKTDTDIRAPLLGFSLRQANKFLLTATLV